MAALPGAARRSLGRNVAGRASRQDHGSGRRSIGAEIAGRQSVFVCARWATRAPAKDAGHRRATFTAATCGHGDAVRLPGVQPAQHRRQPRSVDAAVLAALPPHAVLVNVGRGSTVDEGALVAVLQGGWLAGPCSTFRHRAAATGESVRSLPNVLITSHTSALSYPEEIAPIFADNYRRFVAGDAAPRRRF